MKRFTFEKIADAERGLKMIEDRSYLLAYREFVAYFASLDVITEHHLIIAAHFVFGWIPTTLQMRNTDRNLPLATSVLNRVKRGEMVGEREVTALKDLLKNCLSAATKILHFINPHAYPILDSRVYLFINGKANQNRQTAVPTYFEYLHNCLEVTRDQRFGPVRASMNKKIGYEVTALRAVELIMYETGGSAEDQT